jgi:ankyrin repeat protein
MKDFLNRLPAVCLMMLACSIPALSDMITPPLRAPTFSNQIHVAAKAGDSAKVGALLKDNPELVSSRDKGWTPLHVAAEFGRMNVAELLLANKADSNAKVLNVLKYRVIPYDPDPRYVGLTPMHLAVREGYKDVVALMLAKGADVNAKDNGGYTLLHTAVSRNCCRDARSEHNKDMVELLLAKGADVNAVAISGRSPLHEAAEYGLKDIAELLLAHKADANAKNKDGQTPMRLAEESSDSAFIMGVPSSAVWDVVELLRRNGGYNRGPIHDAVIDADLAKVKTQLQKNPNQVSIKDKDGDTPLHIAAKYGLKDIAEILLGNGAEVNAKDKKGHTPLFLAMRNGYADVMELLRQQGGHE